MLNPKNLFSESIKLIKLTIEVHLKVISISKIVYISLIAAKISRNLILILNTYVLALTVDEFTKLSTRHNSLDSKIYLYVGVFISILLVSSLLNKIADYFQYLMTQETSKYYTFATLESLSRLDLGLLESPEINNLLTRVKENYTHRPNAFVINSFACIEIFVYSISYVLILFAFSPIPASILILTSLPGFIIESYFNKAYYKVQETNANLRRSYWKTTDYLEDDWGIIETKIYQSKNFIFNYLKSLFNVFTESEKSVITKKHLLSGAAVIIQGIGFGYFYIYLTSTIISGDLTAGKFVFYSSAIISFSGSLGSLFNSIAKLHESSLYINDIYKIIRQKPLIKFGKTKIKKKIIPPTIEFRNLSFKYPETENYIFKNLNLTIKAGQNIAIVGQNGAGKTSLIKLLCRLYDVTEGEILIDSINIKELDEKSLYSQFSLLTQSFMRYHFDVKTNIAIGDIQEMNNTLRIAKAAKLSGAHDFIKEYENGYNQILSKRFEKGIEPSTGQWQKIAIARALFKNANILILDEPTSNIDPKSEAEIFDRLFKYTLDKTMIIVSHRFSTVTHADRIIVLDKGKIIEDGTHNELITLNGIYKQTFDLQKKAFQK